MADNEAKPVSNGMRHRRQTSLESNVSIVTNDNGAPTDPTDPIQVSTSAIDTPVSPTFSDHSPRVRFSISEDVIRDLPSSHRQFAVKTKGEDDGNRGLAISGAGLAAQRGIAPSLSVDTLGNSAGVHRSSTVPSRMPAKPTAGAMSPRTRDRGYSLRRALFARNINTNSTSDESRGSIELVEAGPSNAGATGSDPIGPGDNTGKKRQSSIVVSPIVEDYAAEQSASRLEAQQPESKKTLGTLSLPNYDLWARGRRSGLVHKLKADYTRLRKYILKQQEIPPSKDGRHIDLDPSQKTPLIDERTEKEYISNTIRSSRYTLYSFLPKQIIFQFSKLANFYFLVISILQMVPGLSTTGTWTTIIPLLVFVAISMGKEGFDDYRRFKLDKIENNREVQVLHAYKANRGSGNASTASLEPVPAVGPKHWASVKSANLKVGDVVKLERDDAVPADIVILHANGPNGVAYIETMALDGETNLKPKHASPLLAKKCGDLEGLSNCGAHIVAEDPNLDLYSFDGRVTVDGQTLPLTTSEIVYRGSVIRNTPEVLGMVINTGEECKIRMNATKNPRTKAPTMQKSVNKIVVVIVCFVFALSLFNTIAYKIWKKSTEDNAPYLEKVTVKTSNIFVGFIIMFNTMVPLSLYVSMEIIKVGQMYLMGDVEMYDATTDTPMEPRTNTINEELGAISYIFSDKTGTLTDNIMAFRKMSVAGTAWLHDLDLQKKQEEEGKTRKAQKKKEKKKGKGKEKATNMPRRSLNILSASASYDAMDEPLMEDTDVELGNTAMLSRANSVGWRSTARPAKDQPELPTKELLAYLVHKPHSVFARKARFFLLSVALCHTCLPEVQENGEIDYQAASPDELALVRAAKELGVIAIDRPAQSITIMTRPGGPDSEEVRENYEVLDVIEFSSKRKRMSIIVRFPNGRICILCKGADSVIIQRLKLANVALTKAADIERRGSMRRQSEAEEALRRQSDAQIPMSPRMSFTRNSMNLSRKNSLNLSRMSSGGGRPSIGGLPRASMTSGRLQPIRDGIDSWLREREQDVDVAAVDDPSAYETPRQSMALSRHSFASLGTSIDGSDDYYDDLIDESIAVNDTAILERCLQHVDDFATEGLRTLMYGYKFIDADSYTLWEKGFSEAQTSLSNRQELIEQAADMLEQDFDLAGATAIEDKLQKGVPETIDKLRRANIKMWMLTGDKRETAINIGHSCRLIRDYSSVYILDASSASVETDMASALVAISSGTIAHSVVVVDGQTLSAIEDNKTLSTLFLDLAILAHAVICCRSSPSQKALLVRKIRHKVKDSVTLAIGDGANDIAMIQEAHVGIGITGREGMQAARISDYSIAQFRFLQRLLLVHGRWCNIRVGKYLLGTLWKEQFFFLTQALYQQYNGYTGTSLYESASLTVFNTLFSSLCVIIPGIFEQDLAASTLLAVPELYTQGQRNETFNFRKYLWWAFMAAADSMLVYWVMYALYGTALFNDVLGNTQDLYSMGLMTFTACVVVINLKLLILESHNLTLIPLIACLITIFGWFLWTLILGAVLPNTLVEYGIYRGFIDRAGASTLWWLTLLLSILAVLVFEMGTQAACKAWWPSDADVFQALERDPVVRKRFEESAGGGGDQNGYQPDEKAEGKEMMQIDEEQEAREGEIRELLERPRVMAPSPSAGLERTETRDFADVEGGVQTGAGGLRAVKNWNLLPVLRKKGARVGGGETLQLSPLTRSPPKVDTDGVEKGNAGNGNGAGGGGGEGQRQSEDVDALLRGRFGEVVRSEASGGGSGLA